MDQNFGNKQRLFGSYAKDNRTYQNPNVYGTEGDPVQFTYPSNPDSVKFGYLYTITPTWIAEIRYAYNHLFLPRNPAVWGMTWAS